ncbi:hypothetical protein BV25DRAFT_1915916 [Artomyces pyxidatus]|uniref:Uncharacterized protein n=1 Tax=Artomyces pyxidatus TaxID=48021 RepID=A0ACB8T480_9AGAM|nr:hypothetical protein BV25DRAFT_1915916 [Artomyces pyxidatus]
MSLLLPIVYAFLVQPSNSSPLASTTVLIPVNHTLPSALALAESSVAQTCTDIDTCRTRYNIVWSSLVTILACVWTAVHRNIPGPTTSDESRLQHVVARLLEVVKIVVVTLLVPEWVLAWAVRQFLNARDVGRELEAAREKAEKAWQTKKWMHEGDSARGERADSGGVEPWERMPLVRRRKEQLDGLSPTVNKRVGRLNKKWTTRHGFFVIMGGFHHYEDGEPQHPLSRRDVVKLVESGELVPPTEEEIHGWSQGDALSKTLAIVQTLWFVIQGIARRVEGLPITQLEVMTLAYATITVAMYVAWWGKPQNVGGPVRVAVDDFPSKEPLIVWESWIGYIFSVIGGAQDQGVDLRKEPRIPTFYGGATDDYSGLYADVVALAAAMVFGAVHCAAWHYAFPSHAEETIWRISSIAIVAAPGAMLLVTLAMVSLGSSIDVVAYIAALVFFPSAPIYVAARLLLLALSFSTLRSLPYEVYQAVQWTLLIPHFS